MFRLRGRIVEGNIVDVGHVEANIYVSADESRKVGIVHISEHVVKGRRFPVLNVNIILLKRTPVIGYVDSIPRSHGISGIRVRHSHAIGHFGVKI